MVVGEGFVNHQEHDAGEEREGQADEDGDLEGDTIDSHPALPSSLGPHTHPGRGAGDPRTGSVSALSLPSALFGPWFPPSATYFLKFLLDPTYDPPLIYISC